MGLKWAGPTGRVIAFCAATALLLVGGHRYASAQSQNDSTQALVKGQVLTTKHTAISAYPYVYYTPETQLAFGAGGIVTFYTSQEKLLRPSKATVSAYYTTTGQYKFSLSPQLYFGQNTVFMSADLTYGYYVDKYWGIGDDTPDNNDEDYTSRAFGLDLNVQLKPLKHLLGNTRTGIVFDYWDNSVADKKTNPYLLSGETEGSDGGVSSGLGFNFIWDTRDEIFCPTKGGFSQGKAVFYGPTVGSDFEFNRYEVDLRQYRGLGPGKALAAQVYLNAVHGSPPFYDYPALGGQRIMRGYYLGRYRDKVYLATQAEYRSHLWKRLGYVLFAGFGDVAGRFDDFRLREMKASLGGGLRFKFSKTENVNLRMDVGFGGGTNGVYFGLEEAF